MKPLPIAILGLIAVGAVSYVLFGTGSDERADPAPSPSGANGKSQQPPRRLEAVSRSTLKRLESSEDFRMFKDSDLPFAEREAAARRLVLAGGLESVAIAGEIKYGAARFSPEFIGEIIEYWPEQSDESARLRLSRELWTEKSHFFSRLGNHFVKLPSMEALEEYYEHFPESSEMLHYLAGRLGDESPLLEAATLNRVIDLFQSNDSKAELRAFGLALTQRVDEVDEDGRMDYIQGLLDEEPPAKISDYLVGQAMEMLVDDPETASEWLLEQSEEMSRDGDTRFVKAMAQRDPGMAIDFLNQLFERGDRKRASRATAAFGDEYAAKQPEAAVEWALALPPDVENRKGIVSSAFVNLGRKDKEKALVALEQVDKETKMTVESIFATLIKNGQME